MTDGILYCKGKIEVPVDNIIKTSILKGKHKSKLADHPGEPKH